MGVSGFLVEGMRTIRVQIERIGAVSIEQRLSEVVAQTEVVNIFTQPINVVVRNLP